jgi:hypothetical protein
MLDFLVIGIILVVFYSPIALVGIKIIKELIHLE